MDKKEFGELVRALREDHLDENLHTWTREKLSEETGQGDNLPLKVDVIGKIERGERQYLAPEELVSLADALKLTTMERQAFFDASTGIERYEIGRKQTPPEAALQKLLVDLRDIRLPFFIVDAYADAIAMNTMLLSFLNLPQSVVEQASKHPIGFNILRIIFDPDIGYRELVGRKVWDEIATYNILLFRGTTIPYRSTPYFKHLINHLRKMGNFRWRWEEIYWQEGDYTGGGLKYSFNHPDWGQVNYLAVESRVLTTVGTLTLVVYTPTDVHTSQAFAQLAAVPGNLDQQKLANWPQKSVPESV